MKYIIIEEKVKMLEIRELSFNFESLRGGGKFHLIQLPISFLLLANAEYIINSILKPKLHRDFGALYIGELEVE